MSDIFSLFCKKISLCRLIVSLSFNRPHQPDRQALAGASPFDGKIFCAAQASQNPCRGTHLSDCFGLCIGPQLTEGRFTPSMSKDRLPSVQSVFPYSMSVPCSQPRLLPMIRQLPYTAGPIRGPHRFTCAKDRISRIVAGRLAAIGRC